MLSLQHFKQTIYHINSNGLRLNGSDITAMMYVVILVIHTPQRFQTDRFVTDRFMVQKKNRQKMFHFVRGSNCDMNYILVAN